VYEYVRVQGNERTVVARHLFWLSFTNFHIETRTTDADVWDCKMCADYTATSVQGSRLSGVKWNAAVKLVDLPGETAENPLHFLSVTN
jgi:hypothetical protein